MFGVIERVSFKALAKEEAPFRYLILVLVFLFSAMLHGSAVLYKYFFHFKDFLWTEGFPILSLARMASFDALALTCMVMGGTHTTAGMTAILVHASTPIFPLVYADQYSPLQKKGNFITLAGLLLAIGFALAHENHRWPTLLYFLGAGPLSAMGTIVKEREILAFNNPVDPSALSSLLALTSFLLTLVFCVPLFMFMAVDTQVTPSDFKALLDDGLACFFGGEDREVDDDALSASHCSTSFLLFFAFTLSSFLLLRLNLTIDECMHEHGDVWVRRGLLCILVLSLFAFLIFEFSLSLSELMGTLLILIGQEVFNQQDLGSDTLEVISTFSP